MVRTEPFPHKKLRQGRYHRPTPFLVTDFLERIGAIFANDPTLTDIGGNTNDVNTFTGLDFGDLTGGVINGENLLLGDNFACFCRQIISWAVTAP